MPTERQKAGGIQPDDRLQIKLYVDRLMADTLSELADDAGMSRNEYINVILREKLGVPEQKTDPFEILKTLPRRRF